MNLIMINYDDTQHFSLSGILNSLDLTVHTEIVHCSDFKSRGVM